MQHSIEFVGGPYDGYQHQLDSLPAGIFQQAALPVSENLIRAVNGEQHGPLMPCHRVALYRLEQDHDTWQYRFIGESVNASAGGAVE